MNMRDNFWVSFLIKREIRIQIKNQFKRKCNGDEMMARCEEWSPVAMDRRNQCISIGRESWRMDDVKATTLKENKSKRKIKLYGDEHKQELNPDCRTNLIAMPVLGRVMLNPLRSQCLLDFFSTTRLSIKKCSP